MTLLTAHRPAREAEGEEEGEEEAEAEGVQLIEESFRGDWGPNRPRKQLNVFPFFPPVGQDDELSLIAHNIWGVMQWGRQAAAAAFF